MRKTISVYWPLAVIVPLAAIALAHAWNTAAAQMPLAADQLTAELARAVSYGIVGSDRDAAALKAMPHGAGVPSSQAI
ncbi:hypothetical protein [Paraburkholderia caballeronis]|uniref:Uncharacterized protein n=1 Tax=Paraburkholderia caballeronis TaxID=416943 RepID=A0A1H7N462_9BURK|nr:hypothetical protein [Paraburkholderia caballeronis]PXW26295.1 hypothetical protein C7403_104167 [Paraburkholderia caballeronis]PXX01842.1 hypothetical protein C7407_104167 [Paraburkholderia caballeronis]RAK00999.1 hypothetical protein C7409_104167 [Paraburkholderia caballeronis]TDV20766.1 hypothetical protein C7408_101279 [Paraburkholderia caballeronis]TDV21196.1 hypothetical protein C7406_10290 [Paraburkholderia caballeronis]